MPTLLTREQILQIPELKKTLSVPEIALKFGVKERTIRYWIPKLRKEGYKITNKKAGRKPIDISK